MTPSLSLYITGSSWVHRADARVKLLSLFTLSVAAFLVVSWAGIAVAALVMAAALLAASLPVGRIIKLSVPLVVLLVFIWLCNAFVWDVNYAPDVIPPSPVPSWGTEEIILWGTFGFSPAGALLGLSYAMRILIIFFAGYVVVFTTSAEALTSAFLSLLKPLRKVHVPVDDVAMVLSLALRFIPLMAEEAMQLQRAQASRGAQFGVGGLWSRIHSWIVVLVPLVVAMFRRAATLAYAMEARCYGAGVRSSLNVHALSAVEWVFLVVFIAGCVALVAWL